MLPRRRGPPAVTARLSLPSLPPPSLPPRLGRRPCSAAAATAAPTANVIDTDGGQRRVLRTLAARSPAPAAAFVAGASARWAPHRPPPARRAGRPRLAAGGWIDAARGWGGGATEGLAAPGGPRPAVTRRTRSRPATPVAAHPPPRPPTARRGPPSTATTASGGGGGGGGRGAGAPTAAAAEAVGPATVAGVDGNGDGDGNGVSGGGGPAGDDSGGGGMISVEEHSRRRWRMVAAASMVHALHAASVYLAPATLLSPMRMDLGLSLSQISLPLNVYRLINAVLLVPAGAVLDRSNPDAVLRTSVCAAAVLGLALPFCNNLPQLVALQAAFAVTKLFGGLTAMLLLVSRAFGDRPGMGTATSMLLAGYSFAGFLAPSLVGTLCTMWGWRVASGVMSVLFLVVGVPLTVVFLRPLPAGEAEVSSAAVASSSNGAATAAHNSSAAVPAAGGGRMQRVGGLPQTGDITRRAGGAAKAVAAADDTDAAADVSSERLIRPDGVDAPAGKAAAATPPTGAAAAASAGVTSAPDAASPPDDAVPPMLTPAYFALLTVVAAFSFSLHVVLDHLLVFLAEDFGGSGLHMDVATRYMSALNLGALITKLSVGPLADRYDKGLLMAVFGMVGGVAFTFLFEWVAGSLVLTSSPTAVGVFVGLFAVAYAGVFSLSTAALQDFGPSRLGLRCNLNMVALFAAGSVGSSVAGSLRTHFGSFLWSFVVSGSAWVGVVGAALAYKALQGSAGRGGGGGGGHQKLATAPEPEGGRAR